MWFFGQETVARESYGHWNVAFGAMCLPLSALDSHLRPGFLGNESTTSVLFLGRLP